MKRKYVKGLIVIVVVIIIGGLFIYQNINKENKPLPEVKLKEIVNKNKSFAIMIQNETGYEEYNSNTWPGEEYVYKEAKCTDNNGALVEDIIVFADGKATLTTTQTVYCTLYFDIKKETIVDILREKTGCLTDELVYGLYRCQGNSIINNYKYENYDETYDIEDIVKNNYICLGADCNEDGKDLYRIIGVTEDGLMKVIKNTPIDQKLAWSTYSEDVKWSESLAYQYLNNEFYNSLSIDLKGMIVKKDWYYGDINANKDNWPFQNVFTPEELEKYNELSEKTYNAEPDEEKRIAIKELSKFETDAYLRTEAKATDNIPANIGLMSITDYCSSFESDKDLNCRTSSYSERLKTPTSNDIGSSWLTLTDVSKLVLTMSRYGCDDNGEYSVWFVNGRLDHDMVNMNIFLLYPVFFLTSDIELSGDGTIEKPFTIGIE